MIYFTDLGAQIVYLMAFIYGLVKITYFHCSKIKDSAYYKVEVHIKPLHRKMQSYWK